MTTDVELLPLPIIGEGFNAADIRELMTDYARANVTHATAARDAEIDALRTRLEDTVRDSTNKIEALRAELERLTAFNDDTCESFNRLSVERTALITRAEQLAEALRRVVKSFPDEGVLLDAGWDAAEVDEACEAYDAARAALEQEKGRG